MTLIGSFPRKQKFNFRFSSKYLIFRIYKPSLKTVVILIETRKIVLCWFAISKYLTVKYLTIIHFLSER